MLNLLTAENMKLRRSKKLWIVLFILSFFPIFQAANSLMTVHYGTELVQPIDTVINGATGVLMIKKNGLTVLLVLAAFISFYIGEEFQHGTIRNALSLGRSRAQYYATKLAVATGLSLVGTLLLTLLGMISFTFAFGFGEVPGISHYFSYAIKAFITLYLLILANSSIYTMIGFLSKNSGISLIWTFLYTVVTGFGAPIFLQTEHFKQVTYWFSESFLFYFDFVKPADIARFPEMILVSLITIVLSSAIGVYRFIRTDIK